LLIYLQSELNCSARTISMNTELLNHLYIQKIHPSHVLFTLYEYIYNLHLPLIYFYYSTCFSYLEQTKSKLASPPHPLTSPPVFVSCMNICCSLLRKM